MRERQSIQSISKSTIRHRNGSSDNDMSEGLGDMRRRPPMKRTRTSSRKRRVVRRVTILVVLILLVILIAVSTIFAKATLTIIPRSESVNIDGIFEATLAPLNNKDLRYEIIGPIVFKAEETISAPRKERNITKSTGTLTVFNVNKSGQPLDLINRSRFVNDDRIYRLTSAVTIPGGRTINGSFVPGTKDVEVVADEAGTSYNIDEQGARFTIPGLAKYEDYADSYAISKTEIVGGSTGERYIADEEDVIAATDRLHEEIRVNLIEQLNGKVLARQPQELLVPEETVFIEYRTRPEIQGDRIVTIVEEGTLRAVAFREIEVARLIYKGTLNNESNHVDDVIHLERSSLSLEIEDIDEFDPAESKSFSFRMNGNAVLKWGVEKTILFDDIKGKKGDEVLSIVARDYPQIIKVEGLEIFPIWRRSITENKNRFNLIITKDSEI